MTLLVGEGTGRSKVGWGGEKSTVGNKIEVGANGDGGTASEWYRTFRPPCNNSL